MIDSTIVRAHQYSAGMGEDIGRSRGGLSTKIHALADALGDPLLFLTAGQTSFWFNTPLFLFDDTP